MCRKVLFSLLVPCLLLVACKEDSKSSDITVVQVNEAKLSVKQFAESLAAALRGMNALSARDENVVSEAKSRIIQRFVHSTLTSEWAKENGIFVRKELLEEKINAIRAQYPDESSFRSALVESNLSYANWVKGLQENLLEELVGLKIRSQIPQITEAEIKSYYDKNKDQYKLDPQMRLSQIVLRDEESADRIAKELKQGAKFEELAKKYSLTPEGENGGDLGWVERGTNEIFDTTFRMGIGQLSRPMKSAFGYHILKPTGRKQARTRPLTEVRDIIERLLLAEKEQAAYSQWLEQQLLKARVYKNEPLIRSINIATKIQ